MKDALTEFALVLFLKLRRLLCHNRPLKPWLIGWVGYHTRVSLSHYLIGIVNADNLIGLVDSLGGCSSPTIEYRDFLSHVLTWFGSSER